MIGTVAHTVAQAQAAKVRHLVEAAFGAIDDGADELAEEFMAEARAAFTDLGVAVADWRKARYNEEAQHA